MHFQLESAAIWRYCKAFVPDRMLFFFASWSWIASGSSKLINVRDVVSTNVPCTTKSVKHCNVHRSAAGALRASKRFCARPHRHLNIRRTRRVRVLGCAAGHSRHGEGSDCRYFSHFAAKPAGYLHDQLIVFRDGQCKNPPINCRWRISQKKGKQQ